MKKMSKITALLLALLLALGMMPAYAGSVTDVDLYTWNTWIEDLKVKFPEMSVEDQYDYIMLLDDSAKMQLIDTLSQEQYEELSAYAMSLEEPIEYKSITFTKAGPFLPAVTVNSTRRMMLFAAKSSGLLDNESIVTSKTLSANGKTLRLENYVTGKTTVTTVTTSTPVDIVLVLDQSGSMAFDFSGNGTTTNANRRQYAMKNAVNNFIDEVANKYSEQCDNRMAIVTFGSNASTLQGWTDVDNDGKTTLKNRIKNLPDSPSGATNVAAGMETAETLMGSGYSYTGVNTNRQKVVIVFTDGVPTTESAFSTTVATNAIASAKKLKDGGVTVYSIGIFTGVNPDQLYGSSSGDVGQSWQATTILGFGDDLDQADVPAGNRFLNYLSSNFADATEIGLKRSSFNILVNYVKYEITKNFTRTASNYYLTATDAVGLNKIFQTISSNIQSGTASVQLNSNTVVKDVISDYFTLPTDANGNIVTSGIKVYTALYKADGTWGEDTASSLVPTVEGNMVSVTGFDFSQNYCSTDNGRQDGNNDASGNFYGRKLIIEIPIEVKDGFLGGNSVPTNTTESGIYTEDGTLMEQYDVPTTDVPVKSIITVADPSKNVYLYDSLTKDELLTDAVVTVAKDDGTTIELKMDQPNFGLETWQNAFVNIETVFTNADNSTVANETGKLTEDKTYTLAASITPTTSGSATATSGHVDVAVNVYKPVVTFKDSSIDYGTTDVAESYYGATNYDSIAWMHGETNSENVTMVGNAPELTYTYSPVVSVWAPEGKVTALVDQPVNVTVSMSVDGNAKDITGYVTGTRKKCECTGLHVACGHTTDTTVAAMGNDPDFVVHITNVVGDLKITKIVKDSTFTEGSKTFNFTITAKDGQVIPAGKGTVTITVNGTDANEDENYFVVTDLVVGDYEITETAAEGYITTYSDDDQIVEVKTDDSAAITVTNTASKNIDVEVQKNWVDENNVYGLRPVDTIGVSITLKGDDTAVENGAVTLTSTGNWYHKWENLPKFTAEGVEIAYTVVEDAVDNYTQDGIVYSVATVDNKETKRADVTNSLKRTELTISKTWNKAAFTYDSGDVESAIVNVLGTGVEYDVVLTKGNEYTVTITNLPVGLTLTLTEDGSWTWRYTGEAPKTITLEESGNSVSFNNNVTNESWLGGDNYATNVFN